MTNQNITEFSMRTLIIAVDFDGTLVTDEYPKIGRELSSFCDFIKMLQSLGVKTILWTTRTGKELDEAVDWCKKHGFTFDAINENIPEIKEAFGEDTRKVFANVYFDDRNRQIEEGNIYYESLKSLWKWLGK